jgi:hypothetical protein
MNKMDCVHQSKTLTQPRMFCAKYVLRWHYSILLDEVRCLSWILHERRIAGQPRRFVGKAGKCCCLHRTCHVEIRCISYAGSDALNR